MANRRSGEAMQCRQNRDVDEDDRGPPGPLRRTLLLHKKTIGYFFVQNFGSTSPARGGFQNLQKNDRMTDIHNDMKVDNHNGTKALISIYGTKAHTTTYGTKADNESFT